MDRGHVEEEGTGAAMSNELTSLDEFVFYDTFMFLPVGNITPPLPSPCGSRV